MEITSYLKKVLDYCAYRERSHSEARQKIRSLGYDEYEAEEIIMFLIEENFLCEQRFAEGYARGKFNYNGWGKMKITQGLKQKEVPPSLIEKALKGIDEEDYEALLLKLLKQKEKELSREKNHWTKRNKIKQFLVQRGFEFHLIDRFLKEHLLN